MSGNVFYPNPTAICQGSPLLHHLGQPKDCHEFVTFSRQIAGVVSCMCISLSPSRERSKKTYNAAIRDQNLFLASTLSPAVLSTSRMLHTKVGDALKDMLDPIESFTLSIVR